MINKMPLRRLTAGLGSAVVALGGVAVLFTATPAVASAGTATALIFKCKYDGNVRSSPRLGRPNFLFTCYVGTQIYPRCWVRGDYSGGDNRWYTWRGGQGQPDRYIHFSQVSSEGDGGGMIQCP